MKHCCNSAGTFRLAGVHLGHGAAGIILYGEQPSADTMLPRACARAAPARGGIHGEGTGGGRRRQLRLHLPRAKAHARGHAGRGLRGTVNPRALSGRGTVSLHGRPARVLGRVCMDQIVVDVTDIPDVKAGDAAILFGGGAADSVDDVAADGHHQL